MNIQQDKAPSQIDHILVSKRWANSVRRCKTKWGIAIQAYGRKYDHALVYMEFRMRLRNERPSKRKDFKALKLPATKHAHEQTLTTKFNEETRPDNVNDQWKRLTNTLKAAQTVIPTSKRKKGKPWETSDVTLNLVKKRQLNWLNMSQSEKKAINKQISRSARNDYRDHVESVLQDIEHAYAQGNSTDVFRLTKSLSNKKSTNLFVQPAKDCNGNPITSAEEQQEAWATFLEGKFVNLQQIQMSR